MDGKRKGCGTHFTLVELLVVVAIMSILLCLMLPALAKAKAKASSIGCSGNMKQIGVAFMSYAQDHNANLPIYNDPNGWCNYYSYWYKAMPIYFNTTLEKFDQCRVFRCPAHQDLFGASTVWPNWQPFASYGMNQHIAMNNKCSVPKWKRPSYCVTLADAKTKDIYNNSFYINAMANNIAGALDYARHSTGANYLMGDMHVEFATRMPAAAGTGWMHGVDWDRWTPY